jgi:endonuclease G
MGVVKRSLKVAAVAQTMRRSKDQESAGYSMKRVLAVVAFFLVAGLSGCKSPSPPPPPPPPPQVPAPPTTPPTAPGLPPKPGAENGALLFGNPSDAGRDANNFLLSNEAFTSSYNAENGGPNWVAWHLDESDLGASSRGAFWPDPLLPDKWQIRPGDYTGSGYDRGHVCPSGDRTRDAALNKLTFVMSNMLPQAPQLNREVWKDLETYERYLVKDRGEELYIVAGGAGSAGRIAKGKVNVPDVCWKIILVLPRGSGDLARVNQNTRVIAVSMPNRKRDEIAQSKWPDWITTVDQLEKTTGYDFLADLPDGVESVLESKRDSGRATSGVSASPVQDTIPQKPATPLPAIVASPPKSSGPQISATSAPVTAPATQVWVNEKSGVYHYPGARYYGKTRQGEYMTEQAAKARGYRAARN